LACGGDALRRGIEAELVRSSRERNQPKGDSVSHRTSATRCQVTRPKVRNARPRRHARTDFGARGNAHDFGRQVSPLVRPPQCPRRNALRRTPKLPRPQTAALARPPGRCARALFVVRPLRGHPHSSPLRTLRGHTYGVTIYALPRFIRRRCAPSPDCRGANARNPLAGRTRGETAQHRQGGRGRGRSRLTRQTGFCASRLLHCSSFARLAGTRTPHPSASLRGHAIRRDHLRAAALRPALRSLPSVRPPPTARPSRCQRLTPQPDCSPVRPTHGHPARLTPTLRSGAARKARPSSRWRASSSRPRRRGLSPDRLGPVTAWPLARREEF